MGFLMGKSKPQSTAFFWVAWQEFLTGSAPSWTPRRVALKLSPWHVKELLNILTILSYVVLPSILADFFVPQLQILEYNVY
jgi:hypothetical protein